MAKAKILLVEDSAAQGKHAKDSLEAAGYEVVWVLDGKAAIKEAVTTHPDIILLDLVLPDISGTEVCRWIKLNTSTKGIPVIMLTVKGAVSDKVSGLEAGADDYLPKPYDEIELNARIYASLRTKALQDELREKNRQLETLLEKVRVMAVTDPLTELYNRRHFETILQNELKRVLRYGAPLSCLMIDIDYFKRINDSYGHQTGDSVLKELSALMLSDIREGVDTIARWGGEEFAILLPQTEKDSALQVASRILESVSGRRFSGTSSDEKVTVSIGIAVAPDPAVTTGEELVRAADKALYTAKALGRNRAETA